MSLVGTFRNTNTGETLTITSANDSNGVLSGTLSALGRTLQVTGHYHYDNSTGSATSIAFFAIAPDPNIFEAWTASATAQGFTTLTAMGSRATIVNGVMSTVGLGGAFVR